jgi:hypothetical protein
LHLRQVLLSTRRPILLDALQIRNGAAFIDADGRLTHQPTRDQLAALPAGPDPSSGELLT